jgi:hypothetical protein
VLGTAARQVNSQLDLPRPLTGTQMTLKRMQYSKKMTPLLMGAGSLLVSAQI